MSGIEKVEFSFLVPIRNNVLNAGLPQCAKCLSPIDCNSVGTSLREQIL